MKKITVVIPVYNGAHTVLKSINSLKHQTFKNWCCIIVNDGSTDSTKDVLCSIDDDRFLIVNFKENKGRPTARQTALKMVKTKYMCMLDADDWYYPHKLEMQFEYMEAHVDITLMSTTWAIVDSHNKLYSVVSIGEEIKKYKFKNYLDYVHVPHASSIIRMEDVGKVCYNLNLKFAEDTDFMRRLLIGKNYVVKNELTYVYNRDQSFSLDKYIKSVNYVIESIYSLPISKISKFKEFLKLKAKISVVFFVLKLGGIKWYLNKMGRAANLFEKEEFERVKNIIFEK
tara:strand:- start:1714 stop:2568 length:855 start_codon:yes stop_codon:yes gene_type:complete